jgi:hypothetical protein
MEVTKVFSAEDLKGSSEAFAAKYESGNLDAVGDAELFFKAMIECYAISKASDDDDVAEYAEIMEDDVSEYGTLRYAIEVRGTEKKFLMEITEDGGKLSMYSGDYAEDPAFKQNIWMDWTPETQLKLMKGNPNTDPEFFSGALTVKGPLKLASKPREWIYAFFVAIGHPVD